MLQVVYKSAYIIRYTELRTGAHLAQPAVCASGVKAESKALLTTGGGLELASAERPISDSMVKGLGWPPEEAVEPAAGEPPLRKAGVSGSGLQGGGGGEPSSPSDSRASSVGGRSGTAGAPSGDRYG